MRNGPIRGELAVLALLAGAPSWAGCAPDQVELRGDWGSARVSVELAQTPQERAQGLMNRDHMGRFSGMLFIFEDPQSVSFWMHNTLIPLDMVFIDEHGTVTRVHENAIPGDETAIPGGAGVLAVLEVNGGMAHTLRLTPGTQVRHPAFAARSPVWPCE